MKGITDWCVASKLLIQYFKLRFPQLLCLPSIPVSTKFVSLLAWVRPVYVVSGPVFKPDTNQLTKRVRYLAPAQAVKAVSELARPGAVFVCFPDQGGIDDTQPVTIEFLSRNCAFAFTEYLLAIKSGKSFITLTARSGKLTLTHVGSSSMSCERITAKMIGEYMTGLLESISHAISLDKARWLSYSQFLYRQSKHRRMLLLAPLLELEGLAHTAQGMSATASNEATLLLQRVAHLRKVVSGRIDSSWNPL